MVHLTVWIFPASAVLISVFACFYPHLLTPYGNLIVPFLGLIMLGMGATLSLRDFAGVAKKPRSILIGMALQFLLMPLLAFGIGHLLHLPKEQFIGLVMVGTVAGGTASNVISYLAGGDLALSITMTACSTVAGIVLTPLLSAFYLNQTVHVPAWAMFKSILLVVALPVSLGLLINYLCRKKQQILNRVCPIVSVVGIVLVIGIIMSLNVKALQQSGKIVILAVILHNLSGLAAGYLFARLLRCDRKTAITIAIEVGMQNSGLAAALCKQFFGIACALPGALFSICHNISGAVLAGFSNRLLIRNDQKPDRN